MGRIVLVGGAEPGGELDAGDVALAAAVAELQDELAVERVDGVADRTPERDVPVVIDHRVVRHDAAAQLHGDERRDDRADAAARELRLPVDAGLGAGAVVLVESAGDVRPEDAVLDREVAERERLEDRVECHGAPCPTLSEAVRIAVVRRLAGGERERYITNWVTPRQTHP